jgi:hypothetical protein
MTRPLRYREVRISFSRDDKWTSFCEQGKFPLVLDPVMAGSQLTEYSSAVGAASTCFSQVL